MASRLYKLVYTKLKLDTNTLRNMRSDQIMPEQASVEIVEFKLPFSRGSKKK